MGKQTSRYYLDLATYRDAYSSKVVGGEDWFSSFFGHLLEQIKMVGGGRISSLQILLTNCEIADILSPDYRWQATIGQYKKPASFSRSNQIEFSSSAHFLIYHWEHDRSNFCGRLAATAHFSLFSLDWNGFDLWDSLLFLFQKFNLFRHAGVSRTYPYLKLVSKWVTLSPKSKN